MSLLYALTTPTFIPSKGQRQSFFHMPSTIFLRQFLSDLELAEWAKLASQ